MLYEFHQWQNEKKSESVHATYLVYGVKKTQETNGHVQEDGDVEMSSSMPEVEPFSEQVPISTLTLAREEHLKGWPQATLFEGAMPVTNRRPKMFCPSMKT